MDAGKNRPKAKRSARRPRKRLAAAPRQESAVYDGATLLGTLTPSADEYIARNAEGRRLGRFPDTRQAMTAIFAARPAKAEKSVVAHV